MNKDLTLEEKVRICFLCNAQFITKHKNRKFCSDFCKKRHEKIYKKRYYIEHKVEYIKLKKEYYQKQRKQILDKNKKYYWSNLDDRRAYGKAYYLKNQEKMKSNSSKNYYLDTEKKKVYQKGWVNRNRLRINERRRIRRINDPLFRLNSNISSAISTSIRGKGGNKWQSLVGYNINELKQHLESQFSLKINWNNYGNYWELDHIIPKNRFCYSSFLDPEFKKCWALDNLQPLEKLMNRSKQ